MNTPAPLLLETRCCIVGGGPAGIMLGFLLARAGVEVLVLEKHRDFFRDFRGDTIHPSTLELMYELGLLEDFLRLPHQEMRQIEARFGNDAFHLADFSHLPVHSPFLAFLPQWDFLDFLVGQARKYPTFRLHMDTTVTGLLEDGERISGVRGETPNGPVEVYASLVIGADGRSSTVRQQAGLEVVDLGAPIDVLWFRLVKHADDPPAAFGFVGARQFMVLIDRGEYWQCAYIIPKDSFPERQAQGLPAFQADVARCAAFLGDRVQELAAWADIRLLTVKLDHLRHWSREGLLCIGDAAHAMSPVGGVGINLALQDAVATANLLAIPLRTGRLAHHDLQAVQRRRERPARLTQRVQVYLHEHLLSPIFHSNEIMPTPLLMKLLERIPRLRRLPARLIGLGFQPEHIQTPEWPLA